MDIVVEFNEAAFRHNISKEDILNALETKIHDIVLEETMAEMTEEEAVAFSEYFINNEVTLGPNGSGWLSQHEKNPWGLESKTVKYLLKKAMEDHKHPARIIDELVSEKIAALV